MWLILRKMKKEELGPSRVPNTAWGGMCGQRLSQQVICSRIQGNPTKTKHPK